MKKILVLAMALSLAFTSLASAASDWTWTTTAPITLTIGGDAAAFKNAAGTTVPGILGSTVFKTSTSVFLYADGTTTAYAVVAGHINGDKAYSSTSDTPELTETDKPKGDIAEIEAALPDVPTDEAPAAA